MKNETKMFTKPEPGFREQTRRKYEYSIRLYCISNRFNAVSTAKELFLARSSLLKRLGRIETLTAIRWDDTREIAHIMLSFELLDLWEKRDPEKTR